MVEYSLDLQNINLSAIRTVRVLRPLKAINRVPSKSYLPLIYGQLGLYMVNTWPVRLCDVVFSMLALDAKWMGAAAWCVQTFPYHGGTLIPPSSASLFSQVSIALTAIPDGVSRHCHCYLTTGGIDEGFGCIQVGGGEPVGRLHAVEVQGL